MSLGFTFLIIGIRSEEVWANEAWGSYWDWDPKDLAFITGIILQFMYILEQIEICGVKILQL